MKELNNYETNIAAGGIWCTYDGQECSGCANIIQIDGNDCSIIKETVSLNTGQVDVGSIVMAIAGGTAAAVISSGATYAFGFGVIASGGIGLLLGSAISIGYTLSH